MGSFGFPKLTRFWLTETVFRFALLTQRQIKRGSHKSVASLIYAIEDFMQTHNKDPKSFHWQKTSVQILTSITRFASHTVQSHS